MDTATKFLQSRTILEDINGMKRERYSTQEIKEWYIPKDPEAKRLVVITIFNSRIYQIDGMSFDITPKTHTFSWVKKDPQTGTREQMKTDLMTYYLIKYGIRIQDPNQPLLIMTEGDRQIFVVPELCYDASLGKDFTQDKFKMKKLQDYKLNNPDDRYRRINTLIEKFQQT